MISPGSFERRRRGDQQVRCDGKRGRVEHDAVRLRGRCSAGSAAGSPRIPWSGETREGGRGPGGRSGRGRLCRVCVDSRPAPGVRRPRPPRAPGPSPPARSSRGTSAVPRPRAHVVLASGPPRPRPRRRRRRRRSMLTSPGERRRIPRPRIVQLTSFLSPGQLVPPVTRRQTAGPPPPVGSASGRPRRPLPLPDPLRPPSLHPRPR